MFTVRSARRLFGALVDRAHALADFQADVPEQGEKAFDGLAEDFVIIAAQQDQQVDVRVRVQLATAVAANGEQGDVGILAPGEAFPGFLQDLIDEPGAILDQAANVTAGTKARIEHFMRAADGLLECSDGAGFQGQLGLELTAVKQFGVHLRHAVAFLI